MKRGAVALALLLAGCASWTPAGRDAAARLARADAFLDGEQYVAAVAAYDDLVRRHPDSEAAAHGRLMRALAADILQARAAVAKLRGDLTTTKAEVARLARDLAARDGELERTRQELQGARQELQGARQDLAARQAELVKLTAETDRLRNVMDDLKRLDLNLERRR